MRSQWLTATLTLALAMAMVEPSYANQESTQQEALFESQAAIPVSSNYHADEVAISAQSAAVVDVQSGRLLYEKNGDDRMLIASLTKIITTIVAIESGVDLNSEVTVSSRAAGKEGSSIYLKVGEKQKLIDLLYAVMLRSGNDAATAVAEYVGKTEANFVAMMNAKVAELGLTGTHFANPHGLDAKDHYSTAHDMAILTAYALRNPIFAEIVKTQVKKIPMPGEPWDRKMYNKNKMLTRYDGADGVKTGYTKAAGRCLASSATKDGRQIVVLTLDASSDWVDHERLLNYGFQAYHSQPIAKENEVIRTLPVHDGVAPQVDVLAGADFQFPLRDKEKDKLRKEVLLDDKLEAPVVAGEQVGEMRMYYEDRLVGIIPLLAATDVLEETFFYKFKQLLKGLITR